MLSKPVKFYTYSLICNCKVHSKVKYSSEKGSTCKREMQRQTSSAWPDANSGGKMGAPMSGADKAIVAVAIVVIVCGFIGFVVVVTVDDPYG